MRYLPLCVVGLIAALCLAALTVVAPDAASQGDGRGDGSGGGRGDASGTQKRSVKSFGAVGDGKADDAAALQKAVDSQVGGVRFAKGTYRITEPIVIDLDRVGFTSLLGDGTATVLMDGPGPAFRFIGTHAGTAAPNTVKPNVWSRQRTPIVDGLEIVGGHNEACGIEADGTMQLTITRVAIRNVLHGVHLVNRNRNVIVSNCHIYENRGVGIYYDDVNLHQSNITGCHISYNLQGGVVSRKGNVRNIHITGCDIEGNMSPDADPTANVLIDCRGSRYGTAEVAVTGCTIQHNNPSPGSANIRIIGRSDPHPNLKVVREGNVTITGNILSDVKLNVHLKDCRGVAISGNTFWESFEHNLLVEDCANIVMGANNFDPNPRYDPAGRKQTNYSLVFRNCADCTLNGLHVTNVRNSPAGVTLEDCRRMNVANCTILDCDNVGLLLKNVRHSRVSGCLIRDDRPDAASKSLQVVGGEGNQIVDNLLSVPAE